MPAEPVERSAIPERRNLDGMFRGMLTRLPLIACSLDAAGQRERLFEWKQLLAFLVAASPWWMVPFADAHLLHVSHPG